MWPVRRLIELFKIELPLVPAPMAGFSTAKLAVSVCDTGGLGSISCAAMRPKRRKQLFRTYVRCKGAPAAVLTRRLVQEARDRFRQLGGG